MSESTSSTDKFDRAEAFVRRLMEEYPVSDEMREWAEIDFDHGYPCSTLTEMFAVFRSGGIRLPRELFDEAMGHIEVLRGSADAAFYRDAFAEIVSD